MRSSVRLRAGTLLRLLVCGAALAPFSRAADHCAPPPPARTARTARTAPLGIELSSRFEHAEYSTESYAGNYSGVSVGAALSRPSWDVALEVPLYHLLKNGLEVLGPGDPYLRGRLQILAAPSESWALGAALGLSAPVGSAEDDLGMGHFMVHPALWLRIGPDTLRSEWTLGYGRVLGSVGDGHGTGPLVDPMNASELSVGGAVVWRPRPALDLRLSGMAAVPLPADSGEARATLGLSAGLLLGKVIVSLGFAGPLLGDPYDAKIESGFGYAF